MHTTGSRNSDSEAEFLVVTHPFHPLAGQRVRILFERSYRHCGRVYICDGGQLGDVTLREEFTSRGAGAAVAALTVEILSEVAGLVSVLKKDLTGERG